jgi:exodeoxyribonuclease VII large subunit
LQRQQTKLATLQAKITGLTPAHQIRDLTHRINLSLRHLQQFMLNATQQNQQLLGNLAAKLDALSPLATLKRGFAIATVDKDHSILRTTQQVKPGDKIHLQLEQGKLGCTVDA